MCSHRHINQCQCPLCVRVGLQEEQKGTVDGELATVIASIALACKQIASLVNRAGISNLTGLDGGENFSVSGSTYSIYLQQQAACESAHMHR